MKDFSDITVGSFIAIKKWMVFDGENPWKLGVVTWVGTAHTIDTGEKEFCLFLNRKEEDNRNYPEILNERTEYKILMTADEIEQRLTK